MSFLERVIREKKREIAANRQRCPLEELESKIGGEAARDFGRAISGGGKVIGELKRRSPTVGGFRWGSELARLASLYESDGASAVSVVTDHANFGTSLEEAKQLKSKLTIPVLIKDFMIDPYQILEARVFGADAVLLIVRILSDDVLARLLKLTHKLGMSALVEVNSIEEVARALDAGAGIVGVNNRDLSSLEVSLETTRRLAPEIPEDVLFVSESGIKTRGEVEELASLGVDAFLVGSALLDAADPGRKLRELLGECGGKENLAWGN